MTDSAIVTDPGERGVQPVFGVIYPPRVALAGFGKVTGMTCAVGGFRRDPQRRPARRIEEDGYPELAGGEVFSPVHGGNYVPIEGIACA
jgi:hypothetical protein